MRDVRGDPPPYPPIGDYALISDCHSAALVSKDGSVDWCCFHRFDARPVFARLLDWRKGGYFRIAPAGRYRVRRRYLPETMMLETRFFTESGEVTVTDCLSVRLQGPDTLSVHPHHQLLRLVRGEAGEVDLCAEFFPRFDYGLTVPRVELREPDLAIVYGGADALVLQCGIPLEPLEIGGAIGRMVLRAGEERVAAVTYARPHELTPQRLEQEEVVRRIETTRRFWQQWTGRCTYDGPYREQVVRSALVLKALTNAPTGAIVAAPTTSLPEQIGGVRNWDYRYCWLRDAAIQLYALFRLGYTGEAHAFMQWLRRTTAGRVEELQIVYGVGGENLLPEFELQALDGYRGSRPVRIGNRAAEQFQLDVYGYLLDTAWLYHRHGGEIDRVFWELLSSAVDEVSRRWEEPDHGMWEVRGAPQHFTSSKVMAWVAVDRAIRLAAARGLRADLPRWQRLRRAIRERILAEAVDPERGAFCQAFGVRVPDASTLLIPLVHFLRSDDPRVRATVEWVARELMVDGLVYRYRSPDGLPPGEGAFVICSFWLVGNLALAGELDRATALFEQMLGYANDVGLLAEEVDPGSGELLGNFPQGFSHVGLIGAAMNLMKARRTTRRRS